MTDNQATAVRTTIVVNAPVEVAFAVFTEDLGGWWPPEHHVLQAPLTAMVFETREGGRVDDVGADGSECQWARVLAYEPPHRVVFSWDISLEWQIESDPDERAKWRCASSLRNRIAHGSNWSTADWIATAKVGRECATRLVHQRAGTSGCIGSRNTSGASRHTTDIGSVGRLVAVLLSLMNIRAALGPTMSAQPNSPLRMRGPGQALLWDRSQKAPLKIRKWSKPQGMPREPAEGERSRSCSGST